MSTPIKRAVSGIEHVIWVEFIHVYLLDFSLFSLILRAITQLPQSRRWIIKSLKFTVYYILCFSLVFVLRHTTEPEPPSLIIDFFGPQQRATKTFLIFMDFFICILQLMRAAAIHEAAVARYSSSTTARSESRARISRRRRAAFAALQNLLSAGRSRSLAAGRAVLAFGRRAGRPSRRNSSDSESDDNNVGTPANGAGSQNGGVDPPADGFNFSPAALFSASSSASLSLLGIQNQGDGTGGTETSRRQRLLRRHGSSGGEEDDEGSLLSASNANGGRSGNDSTTSRPARPRSQRSRVSFVPQDDVPIARRQSSPPLPMTEVESTSDSEERTSPEDQRNAVDPFSAVQTVEVNVSGMVFSAFRDWGRSTETRAEPTLPSAPPQQQPWSSFIGLSNRSENSNSRGLPI
ncbi:hypothetical protein BJ742DRAFT_821770 [Cladochytrium replicatum]|nr:hypothetical protein BJ742DRAFT_821770 [Cladochytrium replicatum]